MGRRITLSLSPLPGRARLFFRRMYFSVCPVWFSQLASPKDPHPPNLTTKHLLCVLGAVRNICGKPQHFLVLMTSCCVLVPSFRERSSSGASSRSKYLKEPRHIPEAIRETFWFYAVPGTISLQFFFLPERGCRDLGCCHCGSRTNALAQLHFRASTEMSTFPHD